MKKIYVSPKTEEMYVETSEMIAESFGVYTEEVGKEAVLAREVEEFGDLSFFE